MSPLCRERAESVCPAEETTGTKAWRWDLKIRGGEDLDVELKRRWGIHLRRL